MVVETMFTLGTVARKIQGLRRFTRARKRKLEKRRALRDGAMWQVVRDWAQECWVQLSRLMEGFYPRRAVRRLRRMLRYVDGVIERVKPLDKPVPVRVAHGEVSLGVMQRFLALPKGEGYLLN